MSSPKIVSVEYPFRKMIRSFQPHLLLKNAELSAKAKRNRADEKAATENPSARVAWKFSPTSVHYARWGLNE